MIAAVHQGTQLVMCIVHQEAQLVHQRSAEHSWAWAWAKAYQGSVHQSQGMGLGLGLGLGMGLGMALCERW